MAISSIGVGAGLPLGTLLDDMRRVEEFKLQGIAARQTKQTARISAYGQLKSELTNVKTAAEALMKTAFATMKTVVTGNAFTASATGTAISGDYSIQVSELAKGQSLSAGGVVSRKDDIGTGAGVIEFTIDGKVQSVTLDKGSSLEDIVAAINKKTDLGVQATILNNGSDAPHQLLINSKKTGTDAAVTNISVTGNDELNNLISFGAAGSNVTESAAANAALTVNGVAMTAQSNTVAGVIDGVTLNLTGKSDAPGSLTVSNDSEAVKAAITKFVTTYNDVLKKVKQTTTYDVEGQKSSALTGDSIPRNIQSRLASLLGENAVDGEFKMLSQIGIRTDPKTGHLTIDDAKLTKAISESPDGVKTLFQDEGGVASKSIAVLDLLINDKGALTTATTGANKLLKNLENEYARAELSIDAVMETHRKRFTELDKIMTQLGSTSNYLMQQLSSLGNNK